MHTPLAQDFSLVWHNPDPEYYVEGSGLIHLEGDDWMAVVPVVPRSKWRHRRSEHSRTHILTSKDGGKNWEQAAELPYYSAVPWEHKGTVYLFAMKGGSRYRNDDLLLLSSDDRGLSWSEPLTLLEGHFWNCHTGMVKRNNHLYWAVDDLSFGGAGAPSFRGPVIVAGNLSSDLMDVKNWRFSNPMPFPGVPDQLKDPGEHGFGKYLEPNVIDVYGKLRVLVTVRKSGLCAVLDVNDDGSDIDLQFTQYHPMPGGHLKFCVIWDEQSQMFWATANPAVNSQGFVDWKLQKERGDSKTGDRRMLFLFYGLDGLNWFQAGCVARADKLFQSFNYATPVIDGDDLGIISRSSIEGPNPHDADYATFHRVHNFRDLAINLHPDTC